MKYPNQIHSNIHEYQTVVMLPEIIPMAHGCFFFWQVSFYSEYSTFQEL